MLLVLLLTVFAAAGLAIADLLPSWSPAPAVVLLVAYLAHLRSQARVAAQRRQRRRAVRNRQPRQPEQPRQVLQPRHGAEPAERTQPVVALADAPTEVPVVPAALADAAAVETQAVEETLADAVGSQWRPTPVPLPTYVTKPKAPGPVRTIDLSKPGAWFQPQTSVEPTPTPPSTGAAEADVPGDDELVERRRAVGD